LRGRFEFGRVQSIKYGFPRGRVIVLTKAGMGPRDCPGMVQFRGGAVSKKVCDVRCDAK
jgi:hypothetical protein